MNLNELIKLVLNLFLGSYLKVLLFVSSMLISIEVNNLLFVDYKFKLDYSIFLFHI
jgi:hypothetical protein